MRRAKPSARTGHYFVTPLYYALKCLPTSIKCTFQRNTSYVLPFLYCVGKLQKNNASAYFFYFDLEDHQCPWRYSEYCCVWFYLEYYA